MDSTGLKIFGENEWLTEKHKTKQTRTWRKLHVVIDESGMFLASELTSKEKDDAQTVGTLLRQIENEIASFRGDGAYERSSVYKRLKDHNRSGRSPKMIVPPRKDAVMSAKRTPSVIGTSYIKEHGRSKWEIDDCIFHHCYALGDSHAILVERGNADGYTARRGSRLTEMSPPTHACSR